MTCEKYRLLAHRCIDGELSAKDSAQMSAHEAECEYCKEYRAAMEETVTRLNAADDHIELPGDLTHSWRQKLSCENTPKQTRTSFRLWAALAAVLVLVFGGTFIYRFYSPSELEGFAGSNPSIVTSVGGTMDSSLLIIQSGQFELSTHNFIEDMEKILGLSVKYGGWIQRQSVQGDGETPRSCDIEARVPEEELANFLNDMSGIGSVYSSDILAENFAAEYELTKDKIAAVESQITARQELLSEELSPSDAMAVSDSLASLQYELDVLLSKLAGFNSRKSYVNVEIRLVEALAGDGGEYAARLRYQFTRSLHAVGSYFRDMLEFLTIAAPWLMIAMTIAAFALLVEKIHSRRMRQM